MLWYLKERTLSVNHIKSLTGELFYWSAILFSNTLGTALGDFIADDFGLGFSGGATLISSLLLLTILAHYFTRVSSVVLFWIAFVLTRPFGATFGDLLTKPTEYSGLGFGTKGSSLLLFMLLVSLVILAVV